VQIYKKLFFLCVVLLALGSSCSKDLAPQTLREVPGKSERKVNRDQRRRGRQAYWSKRRTRRLTRKSERKLARLEKRSRRAEAKLQEKHIKNQAPEVQERMKKTKEEAEQNNSKRTLRQRLRLWKFKK
jgi:hypothetical protein